MKHVPRPAYVAGALSMLLSLATANGPARADAPVADGLTCQQASFLDPTAEPGTQTGQMSGGPVLLTEQDGIMPETGTLTCRVQVNQATHAGSGPSVSGHGTGLLSAGPATINYVATDFDRVYLCSEFTDDSDGVTYYWDDTVSDWSTNVNVPCGLTGTGGGDYPGSAGVHLDGPYGALCGLDVVSDPTAEAGTMSGQLSGGPLVAQDADALRPSAGTLTCRAQVDQPQHTGSGPSVAAHGTGLLTAGPGLVNLVAGADDTIYVCAEFRDDARGQTLYFDAAEDTWSTSPNVPCSIDVGDAAGSDSTVLLDSIICPPLALLFPPEGDVVLPGPAGALWDCPPYGNVRARRDAGGGGGEGTSHPIHKPKRVGYFPAGTIDISGIGPGNTTVSYNGFSPQWPSWACGATTDDTTGDTVVSCTPPTAPTGYSGNLCATVRAEALNQVPGTVQGDSTCSSAAGAAAVSVGPATSASSSEVSTHIEFPWTCRATLAQPVQGPWHVTCVLKPAP